MNRSTATGMIAGAIFIIASILMGGDLAGYFDLPSIMIVMGGTAAATLVSYSFDQLGLFLPQLREAFFKNNINLDNDLEQIIGLANIARREGILALDGENYGDPFLQKGIELIVDGTDPELVKEILEADIGQVEVSDQLSQKILGSMAQYAPAFGMVGTLIGLINMLMFLDDSETLGPSMATALITTFYGVVLANLFFLPFAAKLKTGSEQRVNRLEMLLEGILAIQNGDNPRIIRSKLSSYNAGLNKTANSKTTQQNEEAIRINEQETIAE